MKSKCPICGEPAAPSSEHAPEHDRYLPFCSERCQLVDLGRWLDGDYRIPGDPVDVERHRGESEH